MTVVEGDVAEIVVMKVLVVVKVGVALSAHLILRMLFFTMIHELFSSLYFHFCHM